MKQFFAITIRSRSTRRTAPRRRAFTLVEVAVALSISAVLLYGIGGLFSLFGRIDRANQEQVRLTNDLNRLAEQFRDDIHAAESAEDMRKEPDESPGVVLRLRIAGDHRVVYEQGVERELLRTESNGETVIRRDAFGLGPSVAFAFRTLDRQPRLLTMAIDRTAADGDSDGARSRQVTALVGRDRRSLKAQPTSDEPPP